VLGLFFGVAWLMRRNVPQGGGALPSDVVQVLGRAPLAGKQQMYLVRVGEKLVLVSLGAGGAQTLTEVTDAPEVERLSAACEAVRTGSASASFRQVLTQLGSQPAAGGFFGNGAPANTRNRRHPSRTDGEEAHA